MTLRMRPSVSGPTGIMIGSPVSTAWVPRTNPSVVSIAIVRTTVSPTCWATSRTSLPPGRSTCNAWYADRRQFAVKMHVDDRADDPCDRTDAVFRPCAANSREVLMHGSLRHPAASGVGGAMGFRPPVQARACQWRNQGAGSGSRFRGNDGSSRRFHIDLGSAQRLGAGDDLDQPLVIAACRAVIVQGEACDHIPGVCGWRCPSPSSAHPARSPRFPRVPYRFAPPGPCSSSSPRTSPTASTS